MHSVLLAHRTSPKDVTGETPYVIAHGLEAVIPIEMGMSSARVQLFDPDTNDQSLKAELDLVYERR